MFRNYLKVAFRNIVRNKTVAFVNIFGLALGTAVFLFLLQYITLEESANKFHAAGRRMYRLINQDPAGKTWPETEPGWAALLTQRFPEIGETCRFSEEGSHTVVAKAGTADAYSEKSTGYADGNFFRFFSFPLLQGSAASLNKPSVVFISESTAKKYFGNKNPLSQTLVVNNQFGKMNYTVEGVFADMPANSDIQYNLLFSLETLKNPANLNGNSWAATDNLNSQYLQTFLLLREGTSIPSLEPKLTAMRTELKPDKDGVQFRLQAMSDIHLGRNLGDTYPTAASLKYIYMLGGIAVLILFIAWFNYVNLSTAASFKRAAEVGVRKVIGASKGALVSQFLLESFLTNLLAFLVAIFFVLLAQPLFNALIGKELSLQNINQSSVWVYGLLLLLLGSLLSGGYAAFHLSRCKPVETLKGKIAKTGSGVVLRKVLVVGQFAISIFLVIATLLIYSQLRFMQTKKLGLNPEQLLVIRSPQVGRDSSFAQRKEAFLNALSSESFVSAYCATGSIPSGNYNFTTSGFTQPASVKGDETKTYSFVVVDDRYLNTYAIPLAAGRNFTAAECKVDWNNNGKVMLNETAVKQLGFASATEALQTKIQWDERKLDVIGVVKDYNHDGAQKAVAPLIFYPQPNGSYLTVRLTPTGLENKIASLENLYRKSFAGNPFEYFFVDENFNKLYASEKRYGDIFTAASSLAILIACLGLFGLVRFTVDSRTKEIGVRKVLGAGVADILALLSKDFLGLVMIAFAVAAPVAWWAMNGWLNDFAYRISIGWWVFAITALAAVLIAFATISLQAVKAAMANPVKSLRTE